MLDLLHPGRMQLAGVITDKLPNIKIVNENTNYEWCV